MRLHVADHPLITHKLSVLRDEKTSSQQFRSLVEELVTLLSYEATRDVRTESYELQTPVAKTTGLRMTDPIPLVVPIIRAGLGMLDGFLKLVPNVEVGFLGMRRNEETLQPETYAKRLPENLANRQCFALDPMLATGGSLVAAIDFLFDAGAVDVTAICIVASLRASSGCARPSPTRTSRSLSGHSTRASTRKASSCRASVTRATACTASRNKLRVTC